MIEANVPIKLCYKVFHEAINTATLTDGLTAITIDGKTATQLKHLFGANPAFVMFLSTWGESGTAIIKTSATTKLASRGVQCMLVGYANDHDGE